MIYLATDLGILVVDQHKDWSILRHGLEDKRVTSITSAGGSLIAGTTSGIFRSEDQGHSWLEASTGLDQRHVRWLASTPGLILAGTEPANIFRSVDGGRTWSGSSQVTWLRDEHHWFLPYSPESGCVRGFAIAESRIYAAVEVGGALYSDDQAKTWSLVPGSNGNPRLNGDPEPFIHADVHSIYVHPSSPDLVYAPTGGGFYRSVDGGATWRRFYDCYCRAAWIDPTDQDHIILGPADGVDRNGRIEETRDGGLTWQLASTGLNVPWSRHMVERFTQVGDELLAVLSNGQMAVAPLSTLAWRAVLPEVQGVNAAIEVSAG